MKYCVYTRAFYETPYLDFFIKHYIDIGFEKIIILKGDNLNYSIPNKYINNVDLRIVNNSGNDLIQEYQNIVKSSNYDWVLSIDLDEILLLNKKYKNINDYVTEKLKINKNINIFYFRWGIIENFKSDIFFEDILKNNKLYVNNHIKSMIKINQINNLSNCHITNLKNNIIYFENSVLNKNNPLHNYNENYSYKETILIHLHTRNFDNLIIKSFLFNLKNNKGINSKKIKSKENFKSLINSINVEINYEDNIIKLIDSFKKYIGLKAELPFIHTNNLKIQIDNFEINKFNKIFYNMENQNYLIKNLLNEENINLQKYEYFKHLFCLNVIF